MITATSKTALLVTANYTVEQSDKTLLSIIYEVVYVDHPKTHVDTFERQQ